jgi:hypothetical protein
MKVHRLACLLLFAACSSGHGDVRSEDMGPPDLAPPPVAPSQGIGANDVTVLFPVPIDAEGFTMLPSLSTLSADGPLLTTAQFAQLVPENDNSEDNPGYADFRLVAARIDPCFPSLALLKSAPSDCHHQLRLLMQPISAPTASSGTSYSVLDSAIHLLFDLDDADFAALVQAWLGLGTTQTQNRALPLGVHPTISAEGLSGPTAAMFVGLILTYATPARLVRVSVTDGRFSIWESASYDASPAGLTPIVIAGLASNAATMMGTLEQLDTDPQTVGPFHTNGDSMTLTNLRPLGGTEVSVGDDGPGQVAFTASSAQIQQALALSLQVDDPFSGFNANTLDCSACHTAGRAREFAMMKGHDDIAGFPLYTNAKRNLTVPGSSLGVLVHQRALGYDGTTVVINQRVVNESAAVADALEAMEGM